MNLSGNIAAGKIVEPLWDAIVVGAGPAGAFLARQLAADGLQVLLLEKQRFPRFKVCGGCVSAAALATLRAAGLGQVLDGKQAPTINHFELVCKNRRMRVQLPPGRAISRTAFDAALVCAAMAAGVSFLPQARATLAGAGKGWRAVKVQHALGELQARARVIVGADGLAGSLRKDGQAFPALTKPGSYIGAGAIANACHEVYPAGTIYMAHGRHGYAGIVRVENDQLAIAAALAPAFVKKSGTIAQAVAALLQQAGMREPPGWQDLAWQGTPALTRRPARLSAARFFVLGDAAGYVEPFTGEGITWALNSAAALAPLVRQSAIQWSPRLESEWTRVHRQVVGRRQILCRLAARALRRPLLIELMARLLEKRWLSLQPLANYLHRDQYDCSRRMTVRLAAP